MAVKKNKKTSERNRNLEVLDLNEIGSIIDKVVFFLKEDLFVEYYENVFEIMNDFIVSEDSIPSDQESLEHMAHQVLPESLAHYMIDKNLPKITSLFKNEFIKNNYDVNVLFDNFASLLEIVRSKLTKELSNKEFLVINEYYVKDSFTFKFIKNKMDVIGMIKNTIQDIEKELKAREGDSEEVDEDEDEEDMPW